MTHYQQPANFTSIANAQKKTIDGFEVLIAKHIGCFKAQFLNGFEYTEYYNDILCDLEFASFEDAFKQCKKYVYTILDVNPFDL
jgi:hypothetical protein